jgi:hypothetical protein
MTNTHSQACWSMWSKRCYTSLPVVDLFVETLQPTKENGDENGLDEDIMGRSAQEPIDSKQPKMICWSPLNVMIVFL